MRTLDKDGRLLCELQGKIFESSAAMYGTSSAVFVRRYMNSEYAARMDSPGALDRPTDAHEAFEALNDEYGTSSYGSVTFSSDELFWMGYVYRLWAYVYETSSRSVYLRNSLPKRREAIPTGLPTFIFISTAPLSTPGPTGTRRPFSKSHRIL